MIGFLKKRKARTEAPPSTPPLQRRSEGYDALIVGGGHNGLICAAYLGRAGLKVLVLEQRDRVGGMAACDGLAEGVRTSTCAHQLFGFDETIIHDLKLPRHGLQFAATALPTVAPDGEGHALHLYHDPQETQAGLRAFSEADAAAYAGFHQDMKKYGAMLKSALLDPAPERREKDELDGVRRFFRSLQKFDASDQREFLRLIAASAGDVFDACFETDLLKGVLAFDSVLGLNAGPRSMNSMLNYLMRQAEHASEGAMLVAGGMEALAAALASAARAHHAEIRTGCRVVRILVKEGAARGVELDTGEVLSAPLVISNADPHTTYLSLVGVDHLETEFACQIRAFRSRGLCAKLNLVVDDLPGFRGLAREDLGARIVICPSIDFAEQAFFPAKYGDFSQDPIFEITFPTVHDPSLSEGTHHVLSAVLQYVPYEVSGGWPARHEALVERLIDALAYFAPDLKERIVTGHVLTPLEIEREYGCTGGHWHHGDLALDQFASLRPACGAGAAGQPVSGLYLCGAGAGPGGGLTGRSGRLAAETVVRHHRAGLIG